MPDVDAEQIPKSVTSAGVAWASVVSFTTTCAIVYLYRPFDHIVPSALFVLGSMVVTIFAVDVLVYKVHRRASTGMDYARPDLSLRRGLTKVLGLYATFGIIALLYAIFPVYQNDNYQQFISLAQRLILPVAILALPYILIVDMYQKSPKDGYWHIGQIVTLNWGQVDRAVAWGHMRGWIIKGFFLPLMFGYFCGSLDTFMRYDFNAVEDFVALYGCLYTLAFFYDLSIATIGYATTFRPLDTHIRSAEPTALGWIVCLMCYAPIWDFVSGSYLNYDTDWQWGAWLWDDPVLYRVWGMLILMCLSVYIYASAQFGCRFSNLTHRGIITSGPYRWTKHPAYVFKNISWWLISIPFIPGDGAPETAIRNCLLLACVSGIYFLRAKTEERHLSQDPDYVAYARWIEKYGIFSWVPRIPYMGWVGYKV
ncbi:methyltransferase family protein [Seohaeicola saemankumensis]|uniref:Methyltransferase family protein n=1 Tax=Seohaeicola saemankumensis TaxID=481181 RepID=A0ABW3TAL9_9RHOB